MLRVLAILAVLIVATNGCRGARTAEVGPSDSLTPPGLGACRLLTPRHLTAAANDTPPVSCAARHTAQTFLVGQLPKSTGAAYDARTHGAHVLKTCGRAFERFLGADESLAMRTRLDWSWFRASKLGWQKGARWFRCDVTGGDERDATLSPLPRTVKGLMSKREVGQWMRCAVGDHFVQAREVPCSQAHTWRAVTAVKIGKPTDPYPGDRIIEVRARDNCSDWVGAWLNYAIDYDYGYTIFHETEWKAGNRRALCWAKTDK